MGLFRKKKVMESVDMGKVAYGAQSPITFATRPEALENSAFWSCVVNLSRLYATLPWHAFEMKGNERQKVAPDRLLPKLLMQPNEVMDSYKFRFIMGVNFEMHGEAIAIIERDRSGFPIALYPVSPANVVAHWVDGELRYRVASNGKDYSYRDMLVISNTPTGYTTILSPIQFAYSDLELEVKCKQLQKEYYEGGSVMGNTIKVPSNFTKEQRDEVRTLFNSNIGRYRNYVVDSRVEITPIQIPSSDITKLSEAQKWNATEVARRFNVPPFFIGDTTGTYNNTEQQGIMMVTYCLQPRVAAWEAAINSKICYQKQFVKFNLSGLMRGDHSTRSAYYHNAIMDGWMSINEVRRLEDMPGIGTDGDEHFFPMNYGSLPDIVAGKYSSSSVWNISTEKVEESKFREKRMKDLRYLDEAQAPAKSNRAKLEKLIKTQLKKEIAKVKELVATGQSVDSVLTDFNTWINENAKEMQPQYKAIYLDILKKMIPVVQKETGLDRDVDEASADTFADEYATGLVGRHTGYVYKRVSQALGTEDFDDVAEGLMNDFAISEAEEEVNRSSNAFNVYLFSALGLEWMHVVARADACEFCKSLNGKPVSVNGYILQKGSSVDDGDGGIRHIQKNYKHPPFHTHCSCGVAPGK